MFLDGYIGAPPTVTVFSFSFICAKAGLVAPRLIASAAAAKPASATLKMRFMAVTPLLCVTSPCRRHRSYGGAHAADARSQRRERTRTYDRPRRQTGGRAARRLERNSQHRFACDQGGELAGQGEGDGAVGAQESNGPRFAVGRDQPQLGHARRIGAKRSRYDSHSAALD